jgi:zinc transport system substrate-binding protein
VLTLYSAHTLSKADFEAGETYLSLMERNLLALKEALN